MADLWPWLLFALPLYAVAAWFVPALLRPVFCCPVPFSDFSSAAFWGRSRCHTILTSMGMPHPVMDS